MTLKENLNMSKRGIKLLFQLEKTYSWMLVLTSILSAAIPYIPIYMSSLIIDELVGEQNTENLLLYVLLTIGLAFILYTLNSFLGKIKNYHANIFYKNEQKIFADQTMQMDYEQIESSEMTLLREKIRIESQTGFNLFFLYFTFEAIITYSVQMISSLALTSSLFTNNSISVIPKFFLFTLILLVIVINYFYTNKKQKAQLEMFGKCVDLNAMGNFYGDYMSDYNTGKDVRLYAMEDMLANEHMKQNVETDNIIYSAQKVMLKYVFGSEFMSHLLQYATYIFVIIAAIAGGVSIGSIAKYVSCIILFGGAFQGVIENIQISVDNNKYLKTYFSFFDIPSKMYQGTLPVEKRTDNEYEIEFRNVSFKYPSSENYALRNVSLKLKIGERLAVVGMNGSGKTTFIKLLCRLYDPTEGEILLNGIDIKKYNYDEYMSIFSVVFQDFKLFSFPLGQNVAAEVAYDREKVEACLKEAGFGERYNNMENGTETCLYKDFDEKGVEISGGEAQKIALARALYKNAPFIVLDEPTAALDPIAEYEIYSKFNEIVGDKTAIYISHRLSSCRFCDDIAVFHEGRIIQRGSHDTLVADTNGKYYELWHAQAQYYADNK